MSNNILEEFLNELLQQVKKGELSNKISSLLGELFLKFEMEKKGIDIFDSNENEMMKYYTLGWYIYNSINLEKSDKVNTENIINN